MRPNRPRSRTAWLVSPQRWHANWSRSRVAPMRSSVSESDRIPVGRDLAVFDDPGCRWPFMPGDELDLSWCPEASPFEKRWARQSLSQYDPAGHESFSGPRRRTRVRPDAETLVRIRAVATFDMPRLSRAGCHLDANYGRGRSLRPPGLVIGVSADYDGHLWSSWLQYSSAVQHAAEPLRGCLEVGCELVPRSQDAATHRFHYRLPGHDEAGGFLRRGDGPSDQGRQLRGLGRHPVRRDRAGIHPGGRLPRSAVARQGAPQAVPPRLRSG